jgi:hypothetical protein
VHKMATASHFGAYTLGTVPNTTGTTAGTIVNMGAISVGQTKQINYSDAASSQLIVLPAGAAITQIQCLTTTAFSSAATITLSIGSTTLTATAAITNAGSNQIAIASTSAGAALAANVGTTDAIVTYTVSGTALTTGQGTIIFEYIVRNYDGTYLKTAQTS